jgi:hypothetical protein
MGVRIRRPRLGTGNLRRVAKPPWHRCGRHEPVQAYCASWRDGDLVAVRCFRSRPCRRSNGGNKLRFVPRRSRPHRLLYRSEYDQSPESRHCRRRCATNQGWSKIPPGHRPTASYWNARTEAEVSELEAPGIAVIRCDRPEKPVFSRHSAARHPK